MIEDGGDSSGSPEWRRCAAIRPRLKPDDLEQDARGEATHV